MNRILKHIFIGLIGAVIAGGAHSATLTCSGTVAELGYHAPGMLYLRLSGMNVPVAICSTDVNWAPAGSTGATTPSACKVIYATLLVAKQNATVISNMYFDKDVLPTNCSGFGNWTEVNLRFFTTS